MSALLVIAACAALSLVAAAGPLRPFAARTTVDRVSAPEIGGDRRHHEPVAASDGGTRSAGRRARIWVPLAVAGLALVVATGPFLLGGFAGSPPSTGASAAPAGAVAIFERRVAAHPDDVSARLELALAELESGDAAAAAGQYVAVLHLDPTNPEAHTQLAWILLGAGRPRTALQQVDQALAAHPDLPEALWVRGVVLLRGLHRPRAAAATLSRYLRIAPHGPHRAQARSLLHEASRP